MSGISDPLAPINYGHSFNFFKKYTSSGTAYTTDCNILINMRSTTFMVTLQLETGGPVFYSFDGTTDHGDMTVGLPSQSLSFPNRVISKIWFRGTGLIRVESWATR
jgi:hypothetical protein